MLKFKNKFNIYVIIKILALKLLVMDFLYILFQIFLLTFLGVYIIVGILLLIRAYQTKLHHLIYGGISFSLTGLSQIIAFMFNLHDLFETLLLASALILCVVFTNMVFHKNPSSRTPSLILGITVINSIVYVTLMSLFIVATSEPLYYITYLHDFLFRFIVLFWLGWSSLNAYKKIKDQDIEPWIKARYRIIAIVSFIMSFERIVRIFQPWYLDFGDPTYLESYIVFGIISTMAIIFAVGFALAWFMPERFKRYLNKGYQAVEDKEYSEDELMDIIKRELSNGGPNGNN